MVPVRYVVATQSGLVKRRVTSLTASQVFLSAIRIKRERSSGLSISTQPSTRQRGQQRWLSQLDCETIEGEKIASPRAYARRDPQPHRVRHGASWDDIGCRRTNGCRHCRAASSDQHNVFLQEASARAGSKGVVGPRRGDCWVHILNSVPQAASEQPVSRSPPKP